MLFSSCVFLLYFLPITFIIYYALSFNRRFQNIWLFVCSLIFYAYGEPFNILLMLSSIIINWLLGLFVDKFSSNAKKKKLLLIIACIFNISILFVFKYLNFTIETFNMLGGRELFKKTSLTLPIGISFYTFQALSYVIDVYRGDIKVEKNPFNLGLYIAFFPQLIAGPIVKFKSIAEQIKERKSTLLKFSIGTSRFVVGLGKKILISNSLAIAADQIFSWSEFGTAIIDTSVVLSWIGAICYTLQIYFDFSGYSDMAIGLSLMFVFKMEENFNYPYIATSVNDFWKRWHISLTTWFREYVYIPLGGNRGENKDTMIRNMFIVWLLTGIWHGASFNFIFWGMWHFLFQLMERFFEFDKKDINPIIRRVYTLLEITLGWVLFRAKDLYQAGIYFRNMFGINSNSFWNEKTSFMLKEFWIVIVIGIVFSMPIAPRMNEFMWNKKTNSIGKILTALYPIALFALFFICLSYLVRGGYNPFIYFDF